MIATCGLSHIHLAVRGIHREPSHVDLPFALVADPDGYIIELLARDPIGQGAMQPNLGDQASPVEH